METRFTQNATVEMRQDGEKHFFTGYAAVFYREGDSGTEYPMWDDYIERIQPEAFTRALKEKHDARALFDHESNILLGRVSSGTCELSVDKTGLRFEVPYDETDPDHARVRSKIVRGDLTGCSFAFSNVSADWEERNDDGKTVYIRNIKDLDLHDVGPVTYPAYSATEAGFRSACFKESQLVEARSILKGHQAARQHEADKVQFQYDNLRLSSIE